MQEQVQMWTGGPRSHTQRSGRWEGTSRWGSGPGRVAAHREGQRASLANRRGSSRLQQTEQTPGQHRGQAWGL